MTTFERLAIGLTCLLAVPVAAANSGMIDDGAGVGITVGGTPLRFTIKDLGTLGGDFSIAAGISSKGQVTGYSSTSSSATAEAAFLYEKDQMASLALAAPDGNSFGVGVNASGTVVGYAYGTPVNTPFASAFVAAKGAYTYPDGVAGSVSGVTAINDAGEYVVNSNPPETQTVLTTLYGRGKAKVVPSLGGDQTFGVAINAHGHVTGTVMTSDASVHPFLYADDKTVDLGLPPGTTWFSAASLNDHDEVIVTGEAGWYLFSAGAWKSLGMPGAPASKYSQASGINDGGVIVGAAGKSPVDYHGFLYRHGKMTDLNTITAGHLANYVTVNNAVAINNAGQIAASGTDSRTGLTHAYLLVPTGAKYSVTVITALPGDLITPSAAELATGLSVKQLADDISLQDESLITLTEVAGVDELGRIFVKGYSKETGALQFYALAATARADR